MRGFNYQRCEDIVDRKLMFFHCFSLGSLGFEASTSSTYGDMFVDIFVINDGCLMIFLGIILLYFILGMKLDFHVWWNFVNRIPEKKIHGFSIPWTNPWGIIIDIISGVYPSANRLKWWWTNRLWFTSHLLRVWNLTSKPQVGFSDWFQIKNNWSYFESPSRVVWTTMNPEM